jgi:hypothetical protein
VCVHQLLNQFVDFYEIQCGDIAIEGDLDAIVFNAVALILQNGGRSNFSGGCKTLHQTT